MSTVDSVACPQDKVDLHLLASDALAATLAKADALVAQYRLATLTTTTYEGHWRTFDRCVAKLGYRSLPASPAAVGEFVLWIIGEGSGPAPGWSASYVDAVLAAVSDRHRQHGLPDPVEFTLSGTARRDLRRLLLRAQQVIHTRPVTAQDLRTLVSMRLPRSLADAAREVALLACATAGLSLAQVRRSDPRLVDGALLLTPPGAAPIALDATCRCGRSDVLLQCCLRCAFRVWQQGGRSWGRGVPWSTLEEAACRLDRSARTAEAVDAFVLAHARPRALTFLRMRAWILLGFDRALRAQDLRDLRRRDVQRGEEGYRVLLRRGKNDPYGATVLFTVKRQRDADVCPVLALDAWLRVRDALCGEAQRAEQGYAFCPVAGVRLRQFSALTRMSDLAAWRRWCERAGLDDVSQHGLRTGFIVEANRQGHSLEAIAFTARHISEATTSGSYLVADLAMNASRPSPAGGLR